MTGRVGANRIRPDVRQNIIDRTPFEQIPTLIEHIDNLDLGSLLESKERARTLEIKDILDFYSFFKKVLEYAKEEDGLNYPITFSMEFPPSETNLPCFVGRLISRSPFSPNGTKEKAGRFMGEYEDPDYPGELLQEFLFRQQNMVEITIWAKTNKVANELASWLENKFFEYLWAFQWAGFAHPIEWIGRGSDQYQLVREQDMYGTPFTFKVITGKIVVKRVTALRKFAFSLGLITENS